MRSVKHGGKKASRYRYKRNNINSKSKALKKKHDNQTNWLTNAAFTGYRLTPNPEVAAQWNKRLTLKQNMDNMGLAYDVNKTIKAPKNKARKEVVEDVPMEEVAEVSSVAQQKAEANKNKNEAKKASKEQKGKRAAPMEVVDEPMIEEAQTQNHPNLRSKKQQTKEPEPPKEKQQKKEKQKEVEQPKSQAQPSKQKEQKKGKKGAAAQQEEEQMDAEEIIAPPVVANHVSHSAKKQRTEEIAETNNTTTDVTTTHADSNNHNNNNNNNKKDKVKKQASQEKAEKQGKGEKTKQPAAPAATKEVSKAAEHEVHQEHVEKEEKAKAEKTKAAATPKDAPKAAEEKKTVAAPTAVAEKPQPKPVITALEKAAAEEEVRQKKERMYRLLPQDILFCTRMMETHGDDYEAMARDARNVYQDTEKQIQRKIRIFRESPQYQLYLDAKNEGKTYPNGDIEAK